MKISHLNENPFHSLRILFSDQKKSFIVVGESINNFLLSLVAENYGLRRASGFVTQIRTQSGDKVSQFATSKLRGSLQCEEHTACNQCTLRSAPS